MGTGPDPVAEGMEDDREGVVSDMGELCDHFADKECEGVGECVSPRFLLTLPFCETWLMIFICIGRRLLTLPLVTGTEGSSASSLR